jgi:hypothetical protein
MSEFITQYALLVTKHHWTVMNYLDKGTHFVFNKSFFFSKIVPFKR